MTEIIRFALSHFTANIKKSNNSNFRMAHKVTGKPRSFHCGPEIQQMKLNEWLYTSAAEELN